VKKINKIKQQYIKYGVFDLIRWLIFKLFYAKDANISRIKSLFYFKRNDVRIGKNVTFKGISFNVNIGKDFVVYNNCIFEFGLDSKLSIGNSCLFSYGVLVQNNQSITIGDYVQIGEYSSIRDTTHRSEDINKPMKQQEDKSIPIIIGNNVWIGKGCTIIKNGVIVGANSVVKGTLNENCVYAGAPAKLIKERT